MPPGLLGLGPQRHDRFAQLGIGLNPRRLPLGLERCDRFSHALAAAPPQLEGQRARVLQLRRRAREALHVARREQGRHVLGHHALVRGREVLELARPRDRFLARLRRRRGYWSWVFASLRVCSFEFVCVRVSVFV